MNQVFMQLALFHLLLNSFQTHPHTDWVIGYSLIAVISSMIGINVLLIGMTTLNQVFLKLKLKSKKRALLKARKDQYNSASIREKRVHQSDHLSIMYTSNQRTPEVPFEKTEIRDGVDVSPEADTNQLNQLPMYFTSKPIEYTV